MINKKEVVIKNVKNALVAARKLDFKSNKMNGSFCFCYLS